jgi:hypothetical protein
VATFLGVSFYDRHCAAWTDTIVLVLERIIKEWEEREITKHFQCIGTRVQNK